MPLRYKHRILVHLSHEGYQPATASHVARDLRVPAQDKAIFAEAVKMLVDSADLEVGSDDKLRLPSAGDTLRGRLKVNARGFGFLIPDKRIREGDIFIPPDCISDAISGDIVEIGLFERRSKFSKGRQEKIGRVVEIIERGQARFAGTLRKKKKQWLVEPDGSVLHDHVLIRDPEAKNAKAGDKVVIELVQYPEGDYLAEGVIVKVLGKAGKPSVETQAVIAAHDLHDDFPEDVIKEAGIAARTFDEISDEIIAEREDLRDVFTITIDPPDAKDFDDAITIFFDEKTNVWTLGVHIADVSHFVRRGSALDKEALERGTSVYLPRLVLPMLPEVLSNGVCSLQEGVPRLAKSVFMTIDQNGHVNSQRACSSVIQSSKRLTYLEAQALIDGDEKEAAKHAKTSPSYTNELIKALKHTNKLAKVLQKRRHRDGMIVLNLPDVELVFGEEGHVDDVVPEDTAYTHTIIEMFMVEANEAVARIFDDLNLPIIRRIHPDPSVGKMEVLQMYSLVAGVKIPDSPTRKDLQQLLEATRNSPAARAIHFAVLRTLTKATYSPALIGHFALASDHYTHFTSPIRRYPDLSVHRALEAYLEKTENGKKVPGGKKRKALANALFGDERVMDEGELIGFGRHCSEKEVEAEEAERELRSFLVLQFLEENHLGDIFTGVVTGVSARGVFISIEDFLVEGMVNSNDLPQSGKSVDRWRVNPASGRLTASRSGRSIGLGDEVQVKIVKIDLALRHMDLHILSIPKGNVDADAKQKPQRKPKNKAAKVKTKKKKKHRKGHGKGRRGKSAG